MGFYETINIGCDALDDQELYKLFKLIVDKASVEFYLIDSDGRFGYVNEAAASSLGYTEDELLALGLADIDPGLGRDFSGHLAELKAQGRARFEATHLTKDGREVRKEVSSVYVQIGTCAYLCAFAQDITERRRIEKALRQSEEHYRDLFESASDLIQIIRPDGKFLFVNPAWRETFGYTEEEVEDLTIFDLIDPDCSDHCQQTFAEVITEGRVDRIETTFIAKNGEKIRIQGAANCRYHEGSPQFARCIFRNVTEERKLQAQLLQSQKMEAVGRLTSGVAHDFNNLLTTILSYSELSLMRLPEDDPMATSLRAIRDAGIRGASLTRQLLTFSRHQVVDVRVIDLNHVVGALSKMVQRLIHPDIQFTVEARAENSRVLADQHQIEQILLNLALNARDAMASGGRLVISTSEEVLAKNEFSGFENIEPGNYVVLTVSDTGEGMSKEVQEQIFEPFFTTKAQGKGTGLGLATAYGIVKQHSGYIVVQSAPGRGTTFKVYFPMVEAPVASVVTEAVMGVLTGDETILVVDDEPEILEVVRLSLEPIGYTVIEAASAQDALAVVEKGDVAIDLLLTDVILPVMNGRSLADAVQSRQPEVKVLFMSGYTDTVLEQHGVSQARYNFISKPLAPGELAAKIRNIFDQS